MYSIKYNKSDYCIILYLVAHNSRNKYGYGKKIAPFLPVLRTDTGLFTN